MRKWMQVLAFAMLAMTLATAAEAKRLRIPIFVPHFGGGSASSESIVKVLDLPDEDDFLRDDGHYIDLGYHFTANGGEWCGYIGSSTKYVPLTEEQALELVNMADIDQLPPVPERPAKSTSSGHKSPSTWMFVLALIIVAGPAMVFRALRSASSSANRALTSSVAKVISDQAVVSQGQPDWARRAENKLRSSQASTYARPTRTAAVTAGSSRSGSGFGRR